MAVIRLDLVLSAGHVLDEFLDPLSTLAGISVPRQSGSGTIELGEILCSSRRIIGGIIETCEVVGRAGRYLDTVHQHVSILRRVAWSMHALVAGEGRRHCSVKGVVCPRDGVQSNHHGHSSRYSQLLVSRYQVIHYRPSHAIRAGA